MNSISKSDSVKIEKNAIRIFILILAIALIFPFFSVINSITYINKIKKILFYGIETQAVVVENSLKSLTENIYYFEYTFCDEFGNEHKNTTKSNYDYNTAKRQYDLGIIIIKYDIETFDSIEIPFKHSGSLPVSDIFLCIIDIILWIYLIIQFIKLINKKATLFWGKTYIATYSNKQLTNTFGQFDLYKLMYVWKDEKGNSHDGISKDSYLLSEITAFETAKEFQIKAHGNNSVVVTNPKWLNIQNKKIKEKQKYYCCIYCGTKFLSDKKSCPNCGAPQKELIEKINL